MVFPCRSPFYSVKYGENIFEKVYDIHNYKWKSYGCMCVHFYKCDSGEISTESSFHSYLSCLTVIQVSVKFGRHKEMASSFMSMFPFSELGAHYEIKDNMLK